ncbi:MAG: NAD-dependent succinate-semialdehyde dehydrogenase [Pseudodonghicola sp.]
MTPHHPEYGQPALFVDGAWIAETPNMGQVSNPATGKILAAFPMADAAHVERALNAAEAAFPIWSGMSLLDRSAILHKAAAELRKDAETAARHMTLELGKPLAESRLEIENCAALLEWSADAAAELKDRSLDAMPGYVARTMRKEPIGPVAAIAPWNFPASLAARKMASALAVGCPVVVKPAEETPMCFQAVAKALEKAGLPRGTLNVLIGDPGRISAALIASPVIRKIAFTGSTRVGKILGAQAGATAKPCVLELGGHAPVVVFDDADLNRALDLSVATKARNAGQVCISPTRFLVQDGICDAFATGFAEKFSILTVGDGMEPDTQMGPLMSPARIEAVDALVQDAIAQGARVLTGGMRLNRPGNFYAPTVLADVPPEARIMQEEPFGPVAIVNRFTDFDDAVSKANSTDFALGAYAFTGSQDRADRVSAALDAGMVGINGFGVVFLDSSLGGRRQSGYGREGGVEGLEAYLTYKFIAQAEI